MKPDDVDSPEKFCQYAERTLGMPYTRKKDINQTRVEAHKLFEKHPTLDWRSLCRVVDWMRARKKRVDVPWKAITYFRWAWKDGVLPELNWSDHQDQDLEQEIAQILPRLIVTQGVEARTRALEDWRKSSTSIPTPSLPSFAPTANTPF
jgi:hypothetical protein